VKCPPVVFRIYLIEPKHRTAPLIDIAHQKFPIHSKVLIAYRAVYTPAGDVRHRVTLLNLDIVSHTQTQPFMAERILIAQ
jgi:hypothetical protein